jgi:hypothetical protein
MHLAQASHRSCDRFTAAAGTTIASANTDTVTLRLGPFTRNNSLF